MKRWKRWIATLLTMVLVVGCLSFSGFAAEGNKGWILNNGEWTFWKNGEMVTNKMITETKNGVTKTYYLKDDGIMANDETFLVYDLVDGVDISYTCYAFPSGVLAKRNWVFLNDEGKQESEYDSGSWYYFDDNFARLENDMRKVKGITYLFDEEGKMQSNAFAEKKYESGKTSKYYFQYQGNRAEDKWLNIEGDWYSFKSDGVCKTASDSNATYVFDENGALTSDKAPCREVEEIVVNGANERTVEVGSKTNITFDVKLATDSNAVKQELTEDHDYWIGTSKSTSSAGVSIEYSISDGKIKATYTAKMPESIEIWAVMDGIESDHITVTSDWSSDTADNQKADAVKDALGSDDVIGAVEKIKDLSKNMNDKGKINSVWMENTALLENMDESYAMINKNIITQTTTAAAKKLMGSGEVKLVGGSLNASSGDTIELAVDKGTTPKIDEANEMEVSYGLTLSIAGVETSELEIPVLIKMPVPAGMSAEGLEVYHMTSDGTPEPLNSKVNDGEVIFVTDSFSDYVFAGKATGGGGSNTSSGSGSDQSEVTTTKSKISETPGLWIKTEDGKWQFTQADGNLYTNTWIYWKGQWYWLNNTGVMTEGWQDINGKRYYLNPVDGAMKTGWIFVEEKWYYMDVNGAMMTNSTTPDGFKVNELGIWIQ